MQRKYGIVDRLAALATTAALVTAGCGGHGGGEEPSPTTPPAPGAAGLDGRSSDAAANIADEVELRRGLANPLAPSTEVGTIPGSALVDAMGGAHYSFPIDVAPGPGGMTPDISISYDSNRGAGLVGLGFAVDGFGSTIERCNKTIADHGLVAPIRFESDDALCFGGRPMVLVNGTYGEPGSEYRTRRDPFDKIVLLNDDIQAQGSQWEAWLSDGRVIEFSAGSEAQAAGEPPLKWYAERIRDRYGNALEYGWVFSPTWSLPTTISYAGGREVRLEYLDVRNEEGHSDNEVRNGYVAGRYYEKPFLLERIRVYGGGGTHLWDYNFSYDVVSGTRQSALKSAQRCDAAGACLPKTWFTWDQVLNEDGSTPAGGDGSSANVPSIPPVIPPPAPFVLTDMSQKFGASGFRVGAGAC